MNSAIASAKRGGVSNNVLTDAQVGRRSEIVKSDVKKCTLILLTLTHTFPQSFCDMAQEAQKKFTADLQKLQRGNDLIYHMDVPSEASLPTIRGRLLVAEEVMPELRNPTSYLNKNGSPPAQLILEGLEAWGIQKAIGEPLSCDHR